MEHGINPTSILVYLASHTTFPNDLGASHVERTVDRVSIDIRTTHSRDHCRACYNECRRIFASLINSPDANFYQLMPIGFQDFSRINFHRYVYDVELKNFTLQR